MAIHIPMIDYHTLIGPEYIWIDMLYTPTGDGNWLMRMTSGDLTTPVTTCTSASVSANLDMVIPDIFLNNASPGTPHYWADFSYFPTADGNIWFKLTKAGTK